MLKEMRLVYAEALLAGLRMLSGSHPGWSDCMAKSLGLQSAGKNIQLRGLAGWSTVLRQVQRIGGERTLVFPSKPVKLDSRKHGPRGASAPD